MKLWKQYTSEIYGALHYLGTWTPSTRVDVGDIAVMKDRTPERSHSIRDLGVAITIIKGSEVHERGWASSGALSVTAMVDASGPVHPPVSASGHLEVSFNRKHAILMRAERSREDSLDRLDRLRQEMLRLHAAGEWKSDWVLITHVVHARSLMVLISGEKDAKAQLKVSAGVAPDPSAIATASGSVGLVKASGMAYEEHGVKDATPLYQAMRVQERIGRRSRPKPIGKRGRARAQQADFEVVEVTF